MTLYNLKIFDTLERGAQPLVDMGIDSKVTAISWSHVLPGGPNTLTVGIVDDPGQRAGFGASYGYIPEPIETKAFAHVVLSVGAITVWEGRLAEDEIGPLGAQGFIADGYGLAVTGNDYYESTSSSTDTTGNILIDIIAQAAPLITKGIGDEWSDPGVSHTRAEFDGMTLAEVLDQIQQEGGSGYDQWDWWLTIGRRLVLLPRVVPDEANYLIPYRVGEVTIRRNFREIATSAVVSYTSGGVEAVTAAETNNTTAIQYRLNKRIRISADELTATGAAQLRSTELQRRSQPTYATTVTRGADTDQWLTTPGGALVPHWQVMAGQWVQVADMDPLIIVRAEFDPSRGLSLDLGEAPVRHSFDAYLAATCTEVNKVARAINPTTGGRRRYIRQQSAVTALTNANGTYDGTVADVGGAFNQATLNSNFRDLSDTVNALRTALSGAKIIP